MAMQRTLTVALAAACLAGGFAAARWFQADEPAPPASAAGFDATLPLAERIGELERAVSAERQARQLLQEEVLYLTGELERMGAAAPAELPPGPAADVDNEESPGVTRRSRVGWRSSTEYQVQRLVAAGFSEDRAGWIARREQQQQMALLEARHEARRNDTFDDYNDVVQAERDAFRRDLGEADYERYLDGMGRPTSVVVSGVMDTSPAQHAGLLPGDRIVSYGGTRIYSMSDLNRATLAGNDGETVYVQIERDGMPMQIALPRGPLGIMGGGRRRSQ